MAKAKKKTVEKITLTLSFREAEALLGLINIVSCDDGAGQLLASISDALLGAHVFDGAFEASISKLHQCVIVEKV